MKLEHIGIATRALDDALQFWRDALGLEVVHTEVVEEQKVRVAMLPVGEPRIELLEPTAPDSPVAKFLEKRGAGIHHIVERSRAPIGSVYHHFPGGKTQYATEALRRHGERARALSTPLATPAGP